MRQAVWQFLRIPPEIREEFWQNSLQKNRLSLLVICIMIFGMELYNMARVLFLSSSGLGTLNNRIYFGMYCSLLLAAALSRRCSSSPAGPPPACSGRFSTSRCCSFSCGTSA